MSVMLRNSVFPSLFRGSIWDEFYSLQKTKKESAWSDSGFPVCDQHTRDDGTVILEFALAGYDAENLSVEATGNYLNISANKASDKTDDGSSWSRRIARRSFRKSYYNNGDLDYSSLKATFHNGLLQVEVPKKEEAKPKSFKILVNNKELPA